ncbi:MAG: PqqD family peptide modification chaperone, partial [Pseudomonadota bacterium]
MRTAILDEYEVEDEVCDRDLTALLQALVEQNL